MIKCVVWDLDNTLWDGTLLEGDDVRLKTGVKPILDMLDERGILLSIASRNEPETTLEKLRELGVEELFVYPQISWNTKSSSVARVAELLNIGVDSIAFVDDDPFERDEVISRIPGVLLVDADDVSTLLEREEFRPRFVTEDSRRRRSMVRADIARSHVEQEMPAAEFLASLRMILTIGEAAPDDLARVEELTIRTNQLNSTGYTYSYDELDSLRCSPRHRLLVAGLDDRYGTYGKIGLAVVEFHDDYWLLRLLLVSCRVMARGVGPALLRHILREAADAGRPLRAEFIRTDRNRPMYLMFKMEGFREIARRGDAVVLEHDLARVAEPAEYLTLVSGNRGRQGP